MAWMVSALCKWLVASWVDCWEKPLASPKGFLVRYSFRQSQADQQQRTGGGQYAEPYVEQENHQQVEGKPRGIEEREQRRPGDELTDMGQVAQGLPGMPLAALQVAFERGLVHVQVETPL